MPTPSLASNDTDPALDLRVVQAGVNVAFDPLPRALLILTAGGVVMRCPSLLPPMPVSEGEILPFRPREILATSTATLVALY